jgi:regulation of enolase protein 1 (concanavalin A-like superfamily)
MTGDGQIIARVAGVENSNAWAKAGVMIRADLSPGSPHALMIVTPAKGNNFQRRLIAGGTSYTTTGALVTAPYWVKLTRAGNTFTGFQSVDGVTWVQVGTATISMPDTVTVGLALTSHSAATLATAAFDHVSIGR